MKCNNCGAENHFAGAMFCKNCQQPLKLETETPANEKRNENIPGTSPQLDKNIPKLSTSVEDSDELEIGVSDPMDYVMGRKNDETSKPEHETGEKIEPEPIENELTLYRDENIKMTITEGVSGSKIALEDFDSSQTSIISEPSTPAKSNFDETARQTTMPASPIESDIPSSQINSSDQRNTETQILETPQKTSAILGQNETKKEIREATQQSSFNSTLRQSKGVIYLEGNSLILAGGLKISLGDEILINNKSFEVKARPKTKTGLYFGIGGGVLFIIALILLFSAGGTSSNGQLVGTVMGGSDNHPSNGQIVKIPELGKQTLTNQAGFFVFDQVPPGLYTLQVVKDGAIVIQEKMTVLKDQISTLALKERPIGSNNVPSDDRLSTLPEQRKAIKTETSYGSLKLNLEPSSAAVYLDGKPVGIGSNTYKVEPGTYSMTVKKQGYQDETRNVTIEQDGVVSLKIKLSEARQESSKTKSYAEMALENESTGNYNLAIKYYDLVLNKNSRDIGALLGKARCFQLSGSHDQATAFYMQAAKIAADKGDSESQVEALTGVINANPNTFTAYYSRGDIYYALGQYEQAIADFSKVIEIDNKNLGAYYKLGNSFLKQKNYPEAIKAFKAAEEINFADPKAQVYLAKAYYSMGDKKNSKKSYEKFKDIASYSTRLEFKKDPEWQQVLTALGVDE